MMVLESTTGPGREPGPGTGGGDGWCGDTARRPEETGTELTRAGATGSEAGSTMTTDAALIPILRYADVPRRRRGSAEGGGPSGLPGDETDG
jgi:hypothetical protein